METNPGFLCPRAKATLAPRCHLSVPTCWPCSHTSPAGPPCTSVSASCWAGAGNRGEPPPRQAPSSPPQALGGPRVPCAAAQCRAPLEPGPAPPPPPQEQALWPGWPCSGWPVPCSPVTVRAVVCAAWLQVRGGCGKGWTRSGGWPTSSAPGRGPSRQGASCRSHPSPSAWSHASCWVWPPHLLQV